MLKHIQYRLKVNTQNFTEEKEKPQLCLKCEKTLIKEEKMFQQFSRQTAKVYYSSFKRDIQNLFKTGIDFEFKSKHRELFVTLSGNYPL